MRPMLVLFMLNTRRHAILHLCYTHQLPFHVRRMCVCMSPDMSHKASSDVPDDGKDADEEVEKKRKSVKEWFLGAVRGFGFLSPCDPSKRFHRYQMLVFMCLLSFG